MTVIDLSEGMSQQKLSNAYTDWQQEWKDLYKEYEDLKEEYNELRNDMEDNDREWGVAYSKLEENYKALDGEYKRLSNNCVDTAKLKDKSTKLHDSMAQKINLLVDESYAKDMMIRDLEDKNEQFRKTIEEQNEELLKCKELNSRYYSESIYLNDIIKILKEDNKSLKNTIKTIIELYVK